MVETAESWRLLEEYLRLDETLYTPYFKYMDEESPTLPLAYSMGLKEEQTKINDLKSRCTVVEERKSKTNPLETVFEACGEECVGLCLLCNDSYCVEHFHFFKQLCWECYIEMKRNE